MTPTLAVVLDFGSAAPLQVAAAAQGLCDLVLVCDPESVYVRASLALLEAVAPVLDVRDPGLHDQLRALGVGGVVSFGDAELVPSARIAEALGLRYHDVETAEVLSDKQRQRARLVGVPGCAARFATIDDVGSVGAVVDAVGLPAVLKPRRGAGSRHTVRVESADELAAAVGVAQASGDRDLIVEELIVGDPTVAGAAWGDYVSVESVARDGVVTHLGVTGKPTLAEPFRERGAFFPSTLAPNVQREVGDLATRALGALGVRWGVCHTEVKLTARGPRLIEVNGRLGGYVDDVYRRATGAGLLRMTMAEALGVPTSEPPAPHRVAFQLAAAPPTWASRVEAVDGVADVRALPGVTHLDLVRTAGAAVDWRAGTSSWVAVLHGTAPDHVALEALQGEFEAGLRVRYS